jgi:hypothetical protein
MALPASRPSRSGPFAACQRRPDRDPDGVRRALADPTLRAGTRRLAAKIAAMDSPASVIETLERRLDSAVAVAG